MSDLAFVSLVLVSLLLDQAMRHQLETRLHGIEWRLRMLLWAVVLGLSFSLIAKAMLAVGPV